MMMQVRAGPDLTSPTSTGRACQTLTLCFSQWKEWGHGGRVKKSRLPWEAVYQVVFMGTGPEGYVAFVF